MNKSKRKWPVIAGVVFFLGFLAAMFLSTTGNAKYRVEICMTFNNGTICRSGAATTREEARRIATASACNDLSNGMTSLMQCQNIEPSKVTWK